MPTTYVQRASTPHRLADHLACYLPSVSEISLKNNGEKRMGGASNRPQGVALA
jgi:hypothetical protein